MIKIGEVVPKKIYINYILPIISLFQNSYFETYDEGYGILASFIKIVRDGSD